LWRRYNNENALEQRRGERVVPGFKGHGPNREKTRMQGEPRRPHRARALLAGVAAAALGYPVAGWAQTAAPAAGTQLEEIIVTATRRQERNQDVPIAITAFTPERLEQQGVRKEQDLQASVPSLVVGPNGNGSREAQSFTLRGQGATFQASPGVVVYLNEVPLPSPLTLSQQGGPGNFVDLENLQVLAGPQGTLFGRNTTGGAVLLVPHKPTDKFSGSIQGQAGNYDMRQLEGVLNVPVIQDKLLVRLVGAYDDRDGYTRDVQWNKDRDNTHWYSGRLGVLARPTDRLENYLMVYGAYSRNNGSGLIHRGFNIPVLQALGLCREGATIPGAVASCDVYRAATAQADALGPRAEAYSVDVFQKTKTWGATNTTSYELTDELTLRNIVSYQRFTSRYRYDGDATVLQQHDVDPGVLPPPGAAQLPGDGTPITYLNASLAKELPRDDLKGLTEELQLQGKMLDDKLTFTTGGFYYEQKPAGVQGSSAILYCPAAFTGFCQSSTQQSAVTQKSKALYAQATLDLGAFSPALDALRVTAGYRYTWDTINGFAFQFQQNPTVPGQVICGATNQPASAADGPTVCRFDAELKSTAPTWLVGLDYKVRPDMLLFAKVSRGYKSGGFNPYAVFPNTRTFRPETVTSYEAGVKSDWRIGDVPARLNATYYYEKYRDIQRATGDFNPTTLAGGARTVNADARIQGVELEGTIRPFRGLEIGGNYSYTDAKYTKYLALTNTGQQDCLGFAAPGSLANLKCLPFQYVSPHIWSLHAALDIPIPEELGKLSLYANYSHTSSQYTEAAQLESAQPGARLEPFGLLNLSLDWKNIAGRGVDAGVFVTNATNKLYRISNTDVFQPGALLYWSTLYGEPRMWGVRLRYRFGD
jgi:iron complex outermembrane receptor protein